LETPGIKEHIIFDNLTSVDINKIPENSERGSIFKR